MTTEQRYIEGSDALIVREFEIEDLHHTIQVYTFDHKGTETFGWECGWCEWAGEEGHRSALEAEEDAVSYHDELSL